jgi:hypothetical protein
LKISGARAYLAVAVTCLGMETTASMCQSEPGVLGNGHGLDHVGVVVRDLSQARQDFAALGFNLSPGGSFPGGLKNCGADFANGTYIELISVAEPHPGSALAAEIKAFGEQHEGAMFAGLDVSSAKETYAFLRGRHFEATDPNPSHWSKEGETKPPPTRWFTVHFSEKPNAGMVSFVLPIFFIEYLNDKPSDQKAHEAAIRQPNTALGIHAVWFAVNDSQAELRSLREAGFAESGRTVKLFDVQGPEVRAGNGVLALLDSGDKRREPARYLVNHEEGIIAISVQVSDLQAAKDSVESALHTKLKTYKGSFGDAFVIPASYAHGLWIEMFEQ